MNLENMVNELKSIHKILLAHIELRENFDTFDLEEKQIRDTLLSRLSDVINAMVYDTYPKQLLDVANLIAMTHADALMDFRRMLIKVEAAEVEYGE